MLAGSPTTALDIATAIVAGYAAVVASLTFAFQVFSWLRTWQTRLKVKLRRMQIVEADGSPEPAIIFEIVNHSSHRVKVTHVSLGPLRKGGPRLFIPHPLGQPAPGPFEIPGRDGVTVWVRPDLLTDYDAGWKTRALVSTADDRDFKSKSVRVRDLLTGS